MCYYAMSVTYVDSNRTNHLTGPTYFFKIESPLQMMTCTKVVLKARSKRRKKIQTEDIKKFFEININITKSTCILKCSVAIYTYQTKRKNNA